MAPLSPGASVEIKETQTNFTRNTTTDDDGRFVALLLPSGKYTITIAKQGFTTLVVEQADLTVGQTMNLQPVSMRVSGVAESRDGHRHTDNRYDENGIQYDTG